MRLIESVKQKAEQIYYYNYSFSSCKQYEVRVRLQHVEMAPSLCQSRNVIPACW
ncbi:conserved hypothetical protein [Vibrio chagasii]|nr:conserved hypothetical protein [Vibrio chagasii]CAH7112981.1 conserved hypothetical protein [Vibrio chagasii]CAH7486880.1 conserved hypothetical protein [Vibrio chagasii]